MKRPKLFTAAILITSAACFAYFRWWRPSPFVLPPGPVIAYELDGEGRIDDPKLPVLHRWSVLRQLTLNENMAARIRSAIADDQNFGGGGKLCFLPGMAFRFGTGRDAVDVLICLKCRHAYFYSAADADLARGSKNLNATGLKTFDALYRSLFQTHPATTNPAATANE